MGKKKIRPIQIKSNPITKTLCTALKDRCTYSMNIQFLEGTVMNALADGYEMPEICEDGDLKFYKRMWGGDDDIFIAKWYKGVPIVFYKIKGMLLKYPTLKMSTINTPYCIKTAKEYLNILCKKGSKIINKDYESLLQYNIGTMAHLQDKRIIGKPKTMNDVFINNTDKQRIIKSLDNFKNKRNWYLENGIPYHFGILLYGPPGTGKTTLARAIGNYLKARQYIFTGDSINMLPRALNEQMLCVSPTQLRCVIVEDIDVGFKEQRYVRDSGTGDKDDKRSGFASLLNSFDGFLVKDEYNNYIIECVIEKGIKDEYRNTLLGVIEELKYDRCIDETCNGKYLNGFCDVCDGYQKPNLVSGVYDLNQDTVIDDVFEITNAGELYYFSDFVNDGNINACAILLNDIIINEDVVSKNEKVFGTYKLNEGTFRTWKPIGYVKGLDILEYDGIFDGNNHFISGIYLDDELFDGAAVFAVANPDALIKNLTVKDIYLNGNKWTSGLVGSIEGTIYNCSVKEAHISGNYIDSYTGGIAGSAIEGTISKCFVEEAEISGINFVGGIVGAISSKSIIENTYSSAYVYGGEYVGGIVGRSGASTTSNSYNIGYVNYGLSDKINVGSICGGFYGGSTFLNCYYLEGTHSVGVYDKRTNFEITEATLNSFENGEIAYLLQNGCTDQIWGQKLSLDDKDLYPVFGIEKVIKVTNEETGEITYINE